MSTKATGSSIDSFTIMEQARIIRDQLDPKQCLPEFNDKDYPNLTNEKIKNSLQTLISLTSKDQLRIQNNELIKENRFFFVGIRRYKEGSFNPNFLYALFHQATTLSPKDLNDHPNQPILESAYASLPTLMNYYLERKNLDFVWKIAAVFYQFCPTEVKDNLQNNRTQSNFKLTLFLIRKKAEEALNNQDHKKVELFKKILKLYNQQEFDLKEVDFVIKKKKHRKRRHSKRSNRSSPTNITPSSSAESKPEPKLLDLKNVSSRLKSATLRSRKKNAENSLKLPTQTPAVKIPAPPPAPPTPLSLTPPKSAPISIPKAVNSDRPSMDGHILQRYHDLYGKSSITIGKQTVQNPKIEHLLTLQKAARELLATGHLTPLEKEKLLHNIEQREMEIRTLRFDMAQKLNSERDVFTEQIPFQNKLVETAAFKFASMKEGETDDTCMSECDESEWEEDEDWNDDELSKQWIVTSREQIVPSAESNIKASNVNKGITNEIKTESGKPPAGYFSWSSYFSFGGGVAAPLTAPVKEEMLSRRLSIQPSKDPRVETVAAAVAGQLNSALPPARLQNQE